MFGLFVGFLFVCVFIVLFWFTNMILRKDGNRIDLQIGVLSSSSSEIGYLYTHHVLLAE